MKRKKRKGKEGFPIEDQKKVKRKKKGDRRKNRIIPDQYRKTWAWKEKTSLAPSRRRRQGRGKRPSICTEKTSLAPPHRRMTLYFCGGEYDREENTLQRRRWGEECLHGGEDSDAKESTMTWRRRRHFMCVSRVLTIWVEMGWERIVGVHTAKD